MTFVTVEGLDGAGGTTVVQAIREELPHARTTREPSELWTGGTLRKCLQDDDTEPLTDFYYFMADRVNHIEKVIKPNDGENSLVVSDRYADSTRAYQPIALAESNHFDSQTQAKLFIEDTMSLWKYEPDLTIYLDISVDTAIERSDGREKYEHREFLEQVKQNYDALIEHESERFVVIDAEQPEAAVREEVLDVIR